MARKSGKGKKKPLTKILVSKRKLEKDWRVKSALVTAIKKLHHALVTHGDLQVAVKHVEDSMDGIGEFGTFEEELRKLKVPKH